MRLGVDLETIESRVPRNATLHSLLTRHIPADLAGSVAAAAIGVFNPRELRADNPYRLVRSISDGILREFELQIDADRFLRVVMRQKDGEDVPMAEVVPYKKETTIASITAMVDGAHSSLIGALQGAGEGVQLGIALAKIFEGDIDFASDIQRGDRFEILFEKILRDGEYAGYGEILGAVVENDGRRLTAIRFEGADGSAGYYDEKGRSLTRRFLRAPLDIAARITSGFNKRRLHPVHGTYRPHLAIDYGAPYGTKVVSVAEGTVVSAGWAGGGGKQVRIRHAGGYESYYLHLSAFGPGIRAGVRVKQGQMIGRVGATGTATGPHLDYRLKKNGQWINPLAEARRMPSGEPLSPVRRAAFEAERDEILGRLVSNSTVSRASN
ncbi:MAG TPA: peptidoglycan DD-metalloendopeptidase family protein [Vicinamibacterales bacterium]|nr:peptidoglycan DD-metalloendopeptidase family protein [Vicinamibacterales bacterium]